MTIKPCGSLLRNEVVSVHFCQQHGRETILSHDGDLKRALSHVLWIGGPPDTGKTSIADLLTTKYGLQVYHFDRHEMGHFARHDPELHPALHAAHPDRMNPEQRWIEPTPEEMAESTIASWTERFGMAVEDVLDMGATSMIVAEGPGFFPECVAPLIVDRHQALWFVPSEAFKRESVARRDKLRGVPVSDHNLAVQNLIGRDLLMGRHVVERARELGLTVYEVDGAKDLGAMAAQVESHFAPWLPPAQPGSD